MPKKILMILTSHDRLGDTDEKTGFWLEEFAAPYYVFKDAGYIVALASPLGGQPPLDPKSSAADFQTEATRRFDADTEGKAELASTRKLSEIDTSEFDAVFYPGGHGPLWDLVSNEDSIRLIQDYWANGKPIASVCHAPIVLADAKNEAGEYIVSGRKVTGFTNGEEDAVGLTDIVPLLVEDTLIERGGHYNKIEDFAPFVQIDGQLVTGQNPASSEPAAVALLELLQ